MRTIYLDTETTDFTPGQIAQLSYIIEEGGKFETAKNFFFTVDSMSPGAENAHGMSMNFLESMSEGRRFIDNSAEIASDINGATLVAHNVDFDSKFISQEMWRVHTEYSPLKLECTMKFFTPILKLPRRGSYGYKYPKLSEVMEYLHIDEKKVEELTRTIFPRLECKEVKYHDASFDTTAMWVCINVYKEKSFGGAFWTEGYTRG